MFVKRVGRGIVWKILPRLPVAVGLASILTPAPYCFALLATGFAALGAWDSFARYRDDAPEWFGAGRSRNTIIVVAALILAFVATAK